MFIVRVIIGLLILGLAVLAAVMVTFAQPAFAQTEPNPNCTLIVPDAPLTAQGLATPYQLVATNPADGPCHETDAAQSAFVQAAIIDPVSGHVAIYNPLVIDQGTTPPAAPIVPTLPKNAIVGIWFGYNGANLRLAGARDGCVDGLGQFAYCNARAFFLAAHEAIRAHKLRVPPLEKGLDGRPCPTVRDFSVVDQDQSDNLTTTYRVTADGRVVQNNDANVAGFPGSTQFGNPSDNRLMNVFINPALECNSWEAPDLSNPGHTIASLPLNELSARAHQRPPIGLIPAGDPFVLNPITGNPDDLPRINAYRRGVDQRQAKNLRQASTTKYCRHIREVGVDKLALDRPFYTAFRSPFPDQASNLFAFIALRLFQSNTNLNCQELLGKADRVTLIMDGDIVVDATIAPAGKQTKDEDADDLAEALESQETDAD